MNSDIIEGSIADSTTLNQYAYVAEEYDDTIEYLDSGWICYIYN